MKRPSVAKARALVNFSGTAKAVPDPSPFSGMRSGYRLAGGMIPFIRRYTAICP